ncbi:MAG: YIP1 family protein [Acutalibacteraceae bacterium]
MVTALILASMFVPCVSASAPFGAPYEGYEYNSFQESIAAPVGYTSTGVYDSFDMGLETPLDNPRDMCFVGDSVYVLDSSTSRIIELNTSFKLKRVHENLKMPDGQPVDFTGAQGIAVDKEGKLYIADTENDRILISDKEGIVRNIITRPDHVLEGVDLPFRVVKLNVSDTGEILAVAESINLGIFVFSSEGEFVKFEGSNPIYQTADVIKAFLTRRFKTKEQLKNTVKFTPLRVLNFTLDDIGYIYTVSFNDKAIDQSTMVRRLNYRGNNILDNDGGFGDFEVPSDEWVITKFIDIDVDSEGFIYLLDASRGRVFQYSRQGYLVSVFGGFGNQLGSFRDPMCLTAKNGKVYVLDAGKKAICEFSPTEYVDLVREALISLDERRPDHSLECWQQVLARNTNSEYPYYGKGLAYDAKGDYKNAMKNFQMAGAKEEYSQAFSEYRKIWIGHNYIWIILSIVVIVAGVWLLSRVLKKRMVAVHGEAYAPLEQKWLFPLYTLFHPIDGFEQFKYRKSLPSFRLSILIVLAWYGVVSLGWFATGFSFRTNRPADFNPVASLVATVGIYLLFVIANWCLCTLFNGKGKMREIFSVCAYSLIPYICSLAIKLLLSNILTGREAALMAVVSVAGLLWSAFLLIGGLYSIHQYSFGKTVLSIIATIVGMGVIMLLLVLFYTLLNQAFSFIQSVLLELSLR